MLAMGFATIIGLLVASYVNINIGEDSIYPTNANNIRIDNLDLLKEHIVDAETGVGSYIVTRDEAFLEPYTSSLPLLKQDLENIKKSYMEYQPNERILIDRLGLLVQKRMANLGRTLQAARQNNLQEARALMYSGKPIMDEIRNDRKALRKLLVGHHEKAMAHSLRGLNLMEGVVYFLGISTTTLLIVWFAATQRQQRLRNEFDHILLERNYALEMKVQKRTEELVALAGYLSNARETEKANLARELHDELGALLTAAKHDTSWIERKLPADLVKGATFMSGLGDLEPVRRSFRNAHLKLDDAMVATASLLQAAPGAACPLIVAFGEHEMPEYRRQGREVAAFWRARGRHADVFELAGRNHFDAVLEWADPASALLHANLAAIGLAAPAPGL